MLCMEQWEVEFGAASKQGDSLPGSPQHSPCFRGCPLHETNRKNAFQTVGTSRERDTRRSHTAVLTQIPLA